MKPKLTMICVSFLLALSVANATVSSRYTEQSAEWFRSEEGRRIADNVLTWQSPHGSWPKNRDTASRPYEGKREKLSGTFDNGATTGELRFLARAFRATNEPRYQQALFKGLDHIIETNRPFFCDRDGIRKYRFNDIKAERRNGYSWYGSWGKEVAKTYDTWKKQWLDTANTK